MADTDHAERAKGKARIGASTGTWAPTETAHPTGVSWEAVSHWTVLDPATVGKGPNQIGFYREHGRADVNSGPRV
jgi:hypothetical protein